MVELSPDRPPIGLMRDERGAEPVTRAAAPIPVTARLRWADDPRRTHPVDCHATAWTSRAVLVNWWSATDDVRAVWVWAGSVRRRGGSAPLL